jgi:hypothetical protein
MDQVVDRPPERLLPHPSVTLLRNRRWTGSGLGFLLGVCAVAVPLLVAVVALSIHSERGTRFQAFSSKAQVVTLVALRDNPESFRGRAVVIRAGVVEVRSSDGLTELLVASVGTAAAASEAGSALAPVVGTALASGSADRVWVTFPGEVAVRAGTVVDIWGVGAGVSLAVGARDHTRPAAAGADSPCSRARICVRPRHPSSGSLPRIASHLLSPGSPASRARPSRGLTARRPCSSLNSSD